MQTRLTLKPGQPGTKKLVRRYGDRLMQVRYRYDAKRRRRYKTVELVVDEAPWDPPFSPEDEVAVRVAYEERALRREVKAAGGRWDPQHKVWRLRYDAVQRLGLEERVQGLYESI